MNNKKSFETPVFVLLVGGIGCFLMSFVLMGLSPWTTLKNITRTAEATSSNPYFDEATQSSSSIGRGRKLYIKEACWHCHSQFVRPVAGEPFRYGPPSTAWEGIHDVPHLYGTRRVGPDLSREAGRRSDDWHFAHLYNPRFVVPESVMPGYPWYFEKTDDGVRPTQEARDLIAYMQYLGNAYRQDIQSIIYPEEFAIFGAPKSSEASERRGAELFTQNCVGCHGEQADGNGNARGFLQPVPANLTQRYVAPSEVYMILYRGVLGSAMPSYGEMPERDLWAIAHYVAKLGSYVKQEEVSQMNFKTVEDGARIYRSRCLVCHGENGDGTGIASAALHPRPKDFTRRVYSKQLFGTIVRNGVAGTAMPPFPDLTDQQIYALSNYLTSNFHDER